MKQHFSIKFSAIHVASTKFHVENLEIWMLVFDPLFPWFHGNQPTVTVAFGGFPAFLQTLFQVHQEAAGGDPTVHHLHLFRVFFSSKTWSSFVQKKKS